MEPWWGEGRRALIPPQILPETCIWFPNTLDWRDYPGRKSEVFQGEIFAGLEEGAMSSQARFHEAKDGSDPGPIIGRRHGEGKKLEPATYWKHERIIIEETQDHFETATEAHLIRRRNNDCSVIM